jgi:threonine synthase
VIDTHTAVASHVYEQYKKETNDNTVTVIASTASPFKFTRAVLGAIDKAEDDDDFKLADQLAAKAGLEIPEAVSSIRNAPVRHNTVVEVSDMEKAVKNFLNM